MKTLSVILLIVAALWFLVNIIWDIALAERERKVKEDREDLRKSEYAHLKTVQLHAEEMEVLRREKEQFKERELNLAARKESVMELEATLLNKQTWLAGEEAALKEKKEKWEAACKEALAEWEKKKDEASALVESLEKQIAEKKAELAEFDKKRPVKKAKKEGEK